MSTAGPYYKVLQASDKTWFFTFYASNHVKVCYGAGYDTASAAREGAKWVVANARYATEQ